MARTLLDLDIQAKLASATNQIIASNAITNVKVDAAAAIAFSKLAALTSGNILVGNGSNVPTSVAVSGDITLSNAGVTDIAAGVIVNADINASAAIAFSKLAALTSANILVGNGSNVPTAVAVSGDITLSNAGVAAIASGVIVDADINASAAIALSKLAEAVIQADGGQAFTAAQSMGGFKLTNLADGTVSTDAATYGQVQALVAGLKWKDPVVVATTANITLSGEQTIDGVLTSASRVLVKDQSTGSQNGIYVSAAGAWSRSTDADASAEVEGAAVFVQQGTVNANRGYTQTADGVTLGSTSLTWALFTATNGDASTLDGLDSLQFLRSDASDSVTTGVTLNIDSGATLSIDGTWDIAGTAVTSSAAELNLLDGRTGTVWTSDNDGSGSGLDADLLDGLSSAAFLRASASSAVATGNTLNIDSGATLSIDGTWDIAGTAVTSSAAELNLLDGATVTTTELNNLGTIVVRETPSGSLPGTAFTLANTPIAGTEELFLNGQLLEPGAGNDYTISGAAITMLFTVAATDRLRACYRY